MTTKLISLTLALAVFLLTPRTVFATHEVEHCVEVYGGGVVCGVEDHEPVEADLGDINPAVLGANLLLISGGLLYLSRRLKAGLPKEAE